MQVWGKQSFFRDPDTGRETGRLNDESTWVRTDVPHLRIIDDALWNKVKSFQKTLDDSPRVDAMRRPQKLFSFLLKWGCCSGGMSKVTVTQYGCSAMRNKGTCDNHLTISERKIEEAVLGALRGRLMDPALSEEFCKEYTITLNRLRMENNAALNANRGELEKVQRKITKLIEAIKIGVDPVLIRDEINGLQNRKLVLQASLEDKQEAPVFVHPQMAQRYQTEIQRLIESMNDPDHRDESALLIRKLIEKIVLTPNEDRSALVMDLYGDLAGILRMAARQSAGKSINHSEVFNLAEQSELQQVRLLVGNDADLDASYAAARKCSVGSAPAKI